MSNKKGNNLSKEKTSQLVSVLFSFLLSLLLVLLAVLAILRVSLSENSIQKIANDATYYGIILEDIRNEAHDFTLPTGIDPAVLDGVFDETEIARDVESAISSSFAGIAENPPDTTALEERIKIKTAAYYEQSGEQVTGVELNDVIQAYANDIAEIYANGVKIIGLEYVSKVSAFIARYVPVAMLLVALLGIVLAMMCVRMHYYQHRGMRFIAYATGAASLILFVGPCAFYVSRIYTRINIIYHSLYYIVTAYISHILIQFFIAAAVLLLLTIVLIIMIGVKRKKVIKAEADSAK